MDAHEHNLLEFVDKYSGSDSKWSEGPKDAVALGAFHISYFNITSFMPCIIDTVNFVKSIES